MFICSEIFVRDSRVLFVITDLLITEFHCIFLLSPFNFEVMKAAVLNLWYPRSGQVVSQNKDMIKCFLTNLKLLGGMLD